MASLWPTVCIPNRYSRMMGYYPSSPHQSCTLHGTGIYLQSLYAMQSYEAGKGLQVIDSCGSYFQLLRVGCNQCLPIVITFQTHLLTKSAVHSFFFTVLLQFLLQTNKSPVLRNGCGWLRQAWTDIQRAQFEASIILVLLLVWTAVLLPPF